MTRLLPQQLHTTDRPSSTAQWTTLGRALELHRRERIVTDEYAPVFLTAASRALLAGLTAGGPVVRQAERLDVAALAASGLCRHRFIDEHLLAALPSVEQVLILGAGYDARAWRFAPLIGDRPVYEVDLAPLSRRKAALVAAHPERFGHAGVQRVEIDFQRDSLGSRLRAAGFPADRPTFVVWEGVSMYLTRAAVTGTVAALAATCGVGSVLAMDFWQQVGGVGGYHLRVAIQRAMRLIGEPITFAVPAPEVAAVLEPFTVLDVAEADELAARYATGARQCDPGMYVVAGRLG